MKFTHVLNVKNCIAYFVDSLVEPSKIYAFSLSAVSGYNVQSQTI